MSAPREHVEAVARGIHDPTCAYCGPGLPPCGAPTEGDGYEFTANVILTSTDPAVHAAMLDALVRAGVLSEEEDESQVWREGRLVEASRARRLVTEWEALP